VCSVYQTSAYVDLSRATLNDLVEDFLRLELGYGDKEITVNNEIGTIYDPDLDDNLEKKLSDLGKYIPVLGLLSCLSHLSNLQQASKQTHF
jgi:ubiquitin-like 1-activating enzyme E1 B